MKKISNEIFSELMSLLTQLVENGTSYEDYEMMVSFCPICEEKPSKHRENCKLANILKILKEG